MAADAAIAGAGAPPETSRGDRAGIFGLLALLALGASLTPIRSLDFWWHLAAGREMARRGALLRVDPFSFTAAGAEWVNHEWLFQVLLFLTHAATGPEALVLAKVAAVLGLALLWLSHLKHEGHGPGGMAVIVAPALVGAAFRFDVRPEMATLLLAPLVVHLVVRARDDGRPRLLFFIPPLVALWANLHAGVVIAPLVLGIGTLVTLAAGRAGASPSASHARALFLTTGAAALAVCCNPWGARLYVVPFDLTRLLASLPSPNLEWARPAPGSFPLFWAALVVGLGLAAAARRGIDPVGTPALLLAGALAALHLRHIGLFFVLLPYGVARPARVLWRAVQASRHYHRFATAGGRIRPGFIAAAVLIVAAIAALPLLPPGVAWGTGVASGNEPAAAVDFLERERIGGRLFNDVRFGGYLAWRRFPTHQVFIDGRNEIYPGLLHDVFAALKDHASWSAFLDRHGIDAAFLRYPPTLQKVIYPGAPGKPPISGERAFSTAYFPSADWALVYWDDDAMIYLRRGSAHEDVIARHEYRAVHPDDWRYLYAGALLGRVAVDPILAEIRRKLGEDPGCVRARGLLASFDALARAARVPPAESSHGGR